jgi:hypothetical protein
MGHRAITDLLKSEVIVEEKIDGSQFSFMNDEGTLKFRSKGKEMFVEAPEQLFANAVIAVQRIHETTPLPSGYVFRGEYLSKPKHNVLCYERIPNNFIVIFDIDDGNEGYLSPEQKAAMASSLGLEVVPVLFQGMVEDVEQFRKLLDAESMLGTVKVEGVVVKPAKYDLFGRDKKVLMGKFVSEAFKEVHNKEWKSGAKGPGDVISILSASYGTPQRWQKAIQHLREAGEIEDSPRDIGKIMKEIPDDVLKECEEEIREKLWAWGWPQLRRMLTRGLPEWYKQSLLDKQFASEGSESVGQVPVDTLAPDGIDTRPAATPETFPAPVLAESQPTMPMAEVASGEAKDASPERESTQTDWNPATRQADSRGGEPFDQDMISQFPPEEVPDGLGGSMVVAVSDRPAEEGPICGDRSTDHV